MPRRISDFPDFYQGWNQVASFGSTISLIATLIFFYVVYNMLVVGAKGRKSPYSVKIITQMNLCWALLGGNVSIASNKSILFPARAFFINSSFFILVLQDVATNWQLMFQDPATSIMEGIIDLHHDIMFFIVWIIISVVWVMFEITRSVGNISVLSLISLEKGVNQSVIASSKKIAILPTRIQHNTALEIGWTLLPCVVLLLIAVPSFSLLYAIEDFNTIESSIKIIGNQWYWTYEIPGDGFEKTFDSVMVSEIDLKETNGLRLLEVDARLLLPIEKQMRLFITSTDVLHSWAVPSLGVKMDACPGRLNQVALWINRQGMYYGQCSEICGINHSFMPIVVQAVNEIDFFLWIME